MLRIVDDNQFAPALRRPRVGDRLRFIVDAGGRMREFLRLQPDDFLAAIKRLSGVAAGLPVGALSSVERAPLRRFDIPSLVENLEHLAESQERARRQGLPAFGPPPEELRAQAERLRRYRSVRAKASVGLHSALDGRQVFSGLMYHLLDVVFSGVQSFLADPAQRANKSRLEIGFSSLLLNKEKVLQTLALRRADAALEKDALAAKISEAEARLEDEDVETAISMGLPVSRDSLERVALRHAAEKQKSEDRKTRR